MFWHHLARTLDKNSLDAWIFFFQVKNSLLERCIELEQTAKDQATDNTILEKLTKVLIL